MKKKICLLLVVVLSLVSLPVFAEDYDNFKAEDNLIVDGTIGSTTFAAGNSVKTSSEIDGTAFIAGNSLSVGSKQDYLFAAGNSVVLNGATAKDAFVAGSTVSIDSTEVRDLYVAASSITINSDVSRNLYAAGGTIIINSQIQGDVNLACESIKLGDNAVITGKLVYPEEASIDIKDKEKIGEIKTYKSAKVDTDVDVKISPVAIIIAKVLGTLYKYVAMLLITFILLALAKPMFEKLANVDKSFGKVALTSLIGFGILCLLPFAAIIAMITIIGIPLGIVSLIVYGLLIYLSIIPTAYYFGNMMFGRSIKNRFLLMTLSLLLIYILKAIPVVGTIVGFVSLIFGLGMYLTLLVTRKEKK